MLCPSLVAVVLSASLVAPSSGVTITQTSQLTTLTYDCIIIGGMSSPLEIQVFHENIYHPGPLDSSSQTIQRRIEKYRAGFGGGCQVSRLNNSTISTILFLSDEGVIPAIAPFLTPTLTPSASNPLCPLFNCKMASLDTPYDWNHTIVPQKGLHGRTFSYSHGRLLGGSSSASEYGEIQRLCAFIEYLCRLYGPPIWPSRGLGQVC